MGAISRLTLAKLVPRSAFNPSWFCYVAVILFVSSHRWSQSDAMLSKSRHQWRLSESVLRRSDKRFNGHHQLCDVRSKLAYLLRQRVIVDRDDIKSPKLWAVTAFCVLTGAVCYVVFICEFSDASFRALTVERANELLSYFSHWLNASAELLCVLLACVRLDISRVICFRWSYLRL